MFEISPLYHPDSSTPEARRLLPCPHPVSLTLTVSVNTEMVRIETVMQREPQTALTSKSHC